MRMNTVVEMAVQQMTCTGCGAEANASCNCGKPYVPKKQRAVDAIKANPKKSNVALAEELGVSDQTVRRAREELGSTYVEPEREGRDGKVYRLPTREVDPATETKDSFFTLVDMALRITQLDLTTVNSPKVQKAIADVIDAWTEAKGRLG